MTARLETAGSTKAEGRSGSRLTRLSRAALALLAATLVGYLVRFATLPVAKKISFPPDDAFYYFELGRSYARDGIWSFDRGRSLTSGFHPLFGYWCALVEGAFPRFEQFDTRLSIHALFAVVLTLSALGVLHVTARRFERGRLLAILLAGCAGGTVILPFQCMEWPLVVVADALALYAFAADRRRLLLPMLVIGSLCRTDFPILGFSMAAAYASMDPRGRETWKRVVSMGAAVLLGTALIMIHSWLASGHFLQTSARTKSYWGSVAGYDFWHGVEPAANAFAPGYVLTDTLDTGPLLLLIPIGLLFAMYAAGRAQVKAFPPRDRAVLRACVLAIVGYGLAYGTIGTAALTWYSAHFVAPMFLLVAALGHALFSSSNPWTARGLPLIHLAAAALAAVNLWDGGRPRWNADGLWEAAAALRNEPRITLAASFNAGMWGYMGGEKVVNVDGLVNDEILAYAKLDRLHCYLVHEDIPWLAEFEFWLSPDRLRYLGIANGRLQKAMHPFDFVQPGPRIWSIDLAALRADPACDEDLRSERSKKAHPFVPGPR